MKRPVNRRVATLAASVAMTLVAGAAWAYWTAASTPTSRGAAAATSVNQGATPNASAAGSTVTVSWAATTLANGDPVSGYLVKRYDANTSALQSIGSACSGTITATTCAESNVPNGQWKYAVTPVFATNWQGPESVKSATVTVALDIIAPTNSITLSSVTGGAYLTGTTVFYRGAAVGSFKLTNAVADAGSGPASSQTSAFIGVSTGWSHTPSTVSTPAGGPYVSNTFSWGASTTSSPLETVTGRDVTGNQAPTILTFTNDSTAPSAGTITYTGGFASGRSASITFTTGTDTLGSGIATRWLQRAQATLNADQSCGTFGSFNNIGADGPTSPYVDSSLASACYMYQYVVTDRVGNQHTATSANVVKIGYAGAVNATTGLLSHWRLGEAATSLYAEDSFSTGTSGTLLSARTGESNASWVAQGGNTTTAEIFTWATNAPGGQAVRRSSTIGTALYYTSTSPPSANYRVEADLVVKSLLSGESTGVVARLNTAGTGGGTFYLAKYTVVGASGNWEIIAFNNGGTTSLGQVAQTLTAGAIYHLALEVNGSTLTLLVDGAALLATSNSTLSAAGRAGVRLANSSSAGDATTGIHLDNYQVTPLPYPRAADSKGSNTGDYKNGPTMGQPGALASDTNTAARFDGVNDHVQVTTPNNPALPTGAGVRSTELWFKTSASTRQVLFRYGSGANTQEYGLWLDSGGTSMTAWGWGTGNDKVFNLGVAVNNGDWHQVVLTYTGTTLILYLDGAAVSSQAATRGTVLDMYGFVIGGIIRPNDGNSGGFFNGWIDEVSFYNTVLSQATITDHYALGNAPAPDTSGPTGGSVDASGLVGTGSRYSTSTTLSVVLNDGTDPSGVASTGKQLRRATATLTSGSCGTFGGYTLVSGGNDPASPYSDVVADQACYSYEYVVLDTLGNSTTYTSPNIKVDTTAPAAPTLVHSAFTNTYWSGSGTTVFYRSGATSGSFTTTASASDGASGIASYAFPALGTGWTSTPGALGVNTYSWSSAGPAAPGTKNVTATNNATLTSPNSPFTMTADNTSPSAGSVTYADTTQSSTSVSVSFTTGTDGGSGIGTRLLQRASATLTGSTCGSYGAFATVSGGTNPTSPLVDTVTAGNCYQYQYVVSDNVGNTHTAASANVVKVQASCGSQLISNGGFENGANPTPWTATAGVVTTSGSVAARTGSWKAWLGGNAADVTETLDQVVTIPANCNATLTYWLRVTTAETTHPFDFFRVQVISGATTTMQTYSDSDAGLSYVQRTVDLSAYAGQTVTLRFLADEDSSLQTSFWLDDVSLDTSTPVQQSYFDEVNGTTGLLNYWRLDQSTTSADTMAGTTGATLQSRNGETGATWTKHGLSDSDAVLTDAGRLRKGSAATWNAVYRASGVPASADYVVEADVYVASQVTNDTAGVIGRMDTTGNVETYYLARYEQSGQSWNLYRRTNGSWDWLGGFGQTLTSGSTYRLSLDMNGTSIRVLVDGVQRISATDGFITAVGRGGIAFGNGLTATTVSNTTGYHLDNFRIGQRMADSKGTNHGDFFNGVTLGSTGAIAGDANTAATFDGTNDYASATRQIGDDFSIEFWFKSTQGIGTGAQWWSGAGMVDAEVSGSANDFGVSLRSDGRVVAGVGTPDVSVVSSAGGYNNGAWHHVVFTRTKTSGALTLYVDGVSAGTANGSTLSLTSPSTINLGRIQAGSNYLNGSLDEVAVYNTALSAATVTAHYVNGTS